MITVSLVTVTIQSYYSITIPYTVYINPNDP